MSHLVFTIFTALCLSGPLTGQTSLEKARTYLDHGLTPDAKRSAIDIIFQDGTSTKELAGARLLLAQIALDEKRVDAAAIQLRLIVDENPDSDESEAASKLLQDLSASFGEALMLSSDNAVAKQYEGLASFWASAVIGRRWEIDSSWIPAEEAAWYWLDKTCAEFPGTPSAERALANKVLIALGNKDRFGLGVLGAYATIEEYPHTRSEYEPRLKEMMTAAKDGIAQLESEFPESVHLPKLRFKVAYCYWQLDQQEDAREWLEADSGTSPPTTIWQQLAQLRLKHWRS